MGGRLMDAGPESLMERGRLCNHCLLIETNRDLILVDTGFGLQDIIDPPARISRFFLRLLSPDFRVEMTAHHQVRELGFDPKDVSHIVLTHLDFDHAGGLDDFPNARVHLLQSERDDAVRQRTWLDRKRYRPQQWSSRDRWQVYQPTTGDSWFGFRCVRPIDELTGDVALVPLIGHTMGHAGVAVRSKKKWLMLAGDAYFFYQEMNLEKPWCTPGLRAYQNMMEKNRAVRLWNQDRLRALKLRHQSEIDIFCSHDAHEFEQISGRSIATPALRSSPTPWQESPPPEALI